VHPDDKAIAAALPGVDYRQLKLDPVAHTVAFGKPGMRIDLGGIAKGYAVDRGIDLLKARGFGRAMVNAGGDTRVMGDRFGKPWMIGIRHPDRKDEVVLRMPIEDAAFSTSGDYERYFEEGGVRYHHVPGSEDFGRSPHAVRSVTIIASNATRTDGLSGRCSSGAGEAWRSSTRCPTPMRSSSPPMARSTIRRVCSRPEAERPKQNG
jgi:thiamine biosynthesis lipoprotein